MEIELFAQQIVNGLVMGSLYALVTMGVTLVFGLTGLVNFAHGQLVMVGAFIAFMVGTQTALSALAALAIATAAGGLIGAGLERGLFRRTLDKPINGFVLSLGLVSIIQSSLALKFGTNPESLASPFPGSVEFLGISAPKTRVFVFFVASGLCLAFYAFLKRSMLGTALRACSQDREVAGLIGIPAPRMLNTAFALGSGLAGAAGVLLAFAMPFTPFVGTAVVVKAFVIALAGGLGSIAGALWVAMLLGVGEALVVGFGWGAYSEIFLFVFIIGLLLFRPQGLVRGTDAAI